jgi:hypothetical protein
MDNTSDRNRNLRKIFETLLSNYSVKVIVVDRPGLELPSSVKPVGKEAWVTLEYGLNMPVPIDDLKVTDVGIEATLSFSRVFHRTFVPWGAVANMAPVLGASSSNPVRERPKLKLVP